MEKEGGRLPEQAANASIAFSPPIEIERGQIEQKMALTMLSDLRVMF